MLFGKIHSLHHCHISDKFKGTGWRLPELLVEVQRTTGFYFDKRCQMKMPSWTKAGLHWWEMPVTVHPKQQAGQLRTYSKVEAAIDFAGIQVAYVNDFGVVDVAANLPTPVRAAFVKAVLKEDDDDKK